MIPLTVMTAILLAEPLSSRTYSSKRGPDCRELVGLKPCPKLALEVMACVNTCEKIISQLNPSKTSNAMAKIIQPRPLRSLIGGGGVMTGGGASGGGGGPASGESGVVSIMRAT